MCEANAYLMKGNEEELFMESVDILRPEREGVYLIARPKSIYLLGLSQTLNQQCNDG